MNPIFWLRRAVKPASLQVFTSTPSKRYCPESDVSIHPMIFISVDFPDPDAPRIARYSPLLTVRLTRFST